MKTKSTNRKEKVCNFIREKTKSISLIMTIAMLSSSISIAQDAGERSSTGSLSGNNTEVAKNPITVQPVKTILGVVPVIPICPVITNFAMVDYSYNKAIFSWDTMTQFDSIIFRYALSGTTNYRTVAISGTPNPGFYILEGLAEQTTYDFEVSSICHTGAVSNWSNTITLTTFAAPVPRLSSFQQYNTAKLTVNPNPASHWTNASFMAPINSVNVVKILSPSGRVEFITHVICTDGKVTLPIDVSNIAPGLYIMQVSNPVGLSNQRFIIQ